jgi:hypothetical protein
VLCPLNGVTPAGFPQTPFAAASPMRSPEPGRISELLTPHHAALAALAVAVCPSARAVVGLTSRYAVGTG